MTRLRGALLTLIKASARNVRDDLRFGGGLRRTDMIGRETRDFKVDVEKKGIDG